jgi:apolipoprotein N-acyltransferase
MIRHGPFVAGALLSGSVGTVVSTGSVAAIAVSILLPALWVRQTSARFCFYCSFAYYLSALWSVPVVARNFFGPNGGSIDGIVLWFVASVLLALPWRFAWSESATSAVWRVPLGLLASVVPPLGLIGWASPTVASGLLFPATGYTGFALTLFMPGCLPLAPRRTVVCAVAGAVGCNLLYPTSPETPSGWQGIDTHYGSIAYDRVDPVREYQIAEDLKARALASAARVIIFPESVLPRWTPASDLLWADTINALRSADKVVVIGVITPFGTPYSDYDFAASLAALHETPAVRSDFRRSSRQQVPFAYTNGVVIRGASSSEFKQRIPVPIGMWRPFTNTGAPLRLSSPAVIRIADQTMAVLICYEQLIPWPVLTSFLERPSIMIAIANRFWVSGSQIASVQQTTTRIWARLFHVPVIFAANS